MITGVKFSTWNSIQKEKDGAYVGMVWYLGATPFALLLFDQNN
jgi:hypothetical protein